jgi:hypothetical protein
VVVAVPPTVVVGVEEAVWVGLRVVAVGVVVKAAVRAVVAPPAAKVVASAVGRMVPVLSLPAQGPLLLLALISLLALWTVIPTFSDFP